MRIFFTLALVTGLLNSVWADNKKPVLAGVYVGVVEGDIARAILKADGTMILHPNDDEPGVVMRGFWKADGNTVTAKLAFFDGDQGTVVFDRDGAFMVYLGTAVHAGTCCEIAGGDARLSRVPFFGTTKQGLDTISFWSAMSTSPSNHSIS